MNEEMFILLILLLMCNAKTCLLLRYIYMRGWSPQKCTGGGGGEGRSDCRETSIVLLHAILKMSGDMIPQEHFENFTADKKLFPKLRETREM